MAKADASLLDPPSAAALPVKPLCPKHSDNENDAKTRDFNSSTDTYVSDEAAAEGAAAAAGTSTERETNRSIMKTTATPAGSPKKSVAFQQEHTLHTYPAASLDTQSPTDESPASRMAHLWAEIDGVNQGEVEAASPPPAPPPHTSSTITGLLLADDAPADVDISQLSEYRFNLKSFSNLSLNEKLDIFLSTNTQATHDDLNAHLDRLGSASGHETDVNIHNLSYRLEDYQPAHENPLAALSRSHDVYLNSAHSSQLSLQSLMDSNRYLHADVVDTLSQGIQFNDGIKGFHDSLADLLIPHTNAEQPDSSGEPLAFAMSDYPTPGQEYHDSFDRSYNLTEKSIMKLLSSASQLDLQAATPQEPPAAMPQEPPAALGPREASAEHERSYVFHPEISPALPELAIELSASPIVKPEPEISYIDQIPERSIKSEHSESQVKPEDISFVKPAETSIVKSAETSVVKSAETSLPMDPIIKQEPKDDSYVESKPSSQSFTIKQEPEDDEVRPEEEEPPIDIPSHLRSPKRRSSADGSLSGHGKRAHSDAHSDAASTLGLKDSPSLHSDYAHAQHPAEAQTYEIQGRAIASGPVKLVHSLSSILLTEEDREDSNWINERKESESENDGDDEDEDEDSESQIHRKLDTKHHGQSDEGSASPRESEDIAVQTLSPTRVDEAIDATVPPREAFAAAKSPLQKSEDSSVLANSSNIQPPFNISLPPVETSDNSFTELTRRLNENSASFEEMLSAENDQDKKALDFLSIWRTQQRSKRSEIKPSTLSYKVPSILNYNTADLSQYGKYHLPQSLCPRKFKEVNVLSTRVVSANHEDLNISGFLPEISHDSGLEDHFRGLIGNQTTVNEGDTTAKSVINFRRRSVGSTNMLSSVQKGSPKLPPRNPNRYSVGSLRPYKHSTETSFQTTKTSPQKKSKFHVPSFEIKRSNSILSPKNRYNDIFEDGSFVEPTIKAEGMKTLPSMDKDDVKRIMQMKQAMTQEEYSGLKLGTLRKMAVPLQPTEKYDSLQQRASIYSESLASEPTGNMKSSPTDGTFSHVFGELSSKPVAIAAKDQLLDDLDMFQINTNYAKPQAEPKAFAGHQKKPADSFTFPEPDPELISNHGTSPKMEKMPIPSKPVYLIPTVPDIFESDERVNPDVLETPQQTVPTPTLDKPPKPVLGEASLNTPPTVNISPVKTPKLDKKLPERSPIKISSPVRLVKDGNSVTGIVLDKKSDSFNGDELRNKKLRPEEPKHGHGLSTVSVPSNLSNNTLMTSGTVVEKQSTLATTLRDQVGGSAPKTKRDSKLFPQEKGKLFLRVVGLKNVNLPDIKNRKASFSITLDNGVHCIKTPNYKLDSLNVLIGKEFELTVGNSLQFILTMKATYDKPMGTLVQVRERKVVKSKNRIGRLFGSKDVVTTTKYVPRDVEDPWKNKFATDGSFARCYVDLEQYQGQINGTACSFDISCFNEWATPANGAEGAKIEPYKIAQLEVKMLYVPRSETYEILPTSIKTAYESLDELRKESTLRLEGYLHQEGGDCETWKKRWFKLSGTSLVAHSEFSHKTRARINLAKVVEVIYVDKENITRSSSNYRNFSDILLVENAFKIRFANGEIIDFGAPNKDEKLQWIRAIQEIVYRNKFRRQPWVKTMQQKNGNRRPWSIVSKL